ncbi:MAG: hypothetical protein AAF602_19280 [Myxococcota bacterium]
MWWLFRAMVLWLALAGAASAQEARQAPATGESVIERPLPPADWTSIPGPYVTLHGPVERTDLLLRLARHGAESASALSDALGVPIGGAIDVYVAPTQQAYIDVQPHGRPPEYADANAWPRLGLVVLRDPRIRIATDEPLEQVLDHELVHVILGRAFEPAQPPRWLQEGAAQLLAHQDGPETVQVLRQAALSGRLYHLETLERGFPHQGALARMAYAVSLDFIQYLHAEYDPEALPKLVQGALKGRTLAHSIETLTGKPLDEVEADWRRPYERPGFSMAFLADLGTGVFWIGGVALLIGGIFRRRQFRRRLAEMEAEERLVDDVLEAMRTRR